MTPAPREVLDDGLRERLDLGDDDTAFPPESAQQNGNVELSAPLPAPEPEVDPDEDVDFALGHDTTPVAIEARNEIEAIAAESKKRARSIKKSAE